MKNFVKVIFLFLACIVATTSFSQSIGIKAGFNLANMLFENDATNISEDLDFKSTPGVHLGVTAEFPFSDLLSFETAILGSTKGYQSEQSISAGTSNTNIKTQINTVYIDIPLTAKATFGDGDTKFYGQAGPYIGIGLVGNLRSETTTGGQTDTDDDRLTWGTNDEDLKRLDFGITVGGGVEMNGFVVGLSYWLGLANISSDQTNGRTISNRNIMISLGYKFGN